MEKTWLETCNYLTSGIYLLTSRHNDEMNGMIASWVSQVSYDHPLIMVAIHQNRSSHRLISRSGRFAVHILGARQGEFLSRFKGPDPQAKFKDVEWTSGLTGCPILRECLGYLECLTTESYKPGNHTLFVGKVIDAKILSPGEPMISRDLDHVYLGRD
jgi:flavin reductase (DIM6/NTAB) family NADH-FMN oxidoreductase RutF